MIVMVLEEAKKQEESEEGERKKYEKWPRDTFEFYQLGRYLESRVPTFHHVLTYE